MSKKLKPGQLEAIKALSMKRYKVSAVTIGLHHYTVMANSQEQAHERVFQEGQGRPAGKEGPVPVMVRVQDMALIDKEPLTLQSVIKDIGQIAKEATEADSGAEEGGSIVKPSESAIEIVGG